MIVMVIILVCFICFVADTASLSNGLNIGAFHFKPTSEKPKLNETTTVTRQTEKLLDDRLTDRQTYRMKTD